MLRYLRILFIAATGLVLLVLALANRGAVSLRLLPEDLGGLLGLNLTWDIPLFVVILGAVALGVFIGFVWEWFREMRIRATARGTARQVSRLERELAVLRDGKDAPRDEVLAILEDGRS
ncbi:LapA family protein [Xinfangfangia sp. CPCC 101601]|uniref:LapA family protein n=1 Tax=Pseudogemmobacter lacusdianii TaxID=3069608 RepID=A0ABU0VWI9_9RHOB|nr:LapA family protein [Xinfangfangia sp. CPCC 101601]MDQ2066089.1 LapA family protein [Xinfangfangia sp. CPCC 101601]